MEKMQDKQLDTNNQKKKKKNPKWNLIYDKL
jgi:hypothetical protein